jgi:uncharacterized radical SAM superfamily Fe-S cluster-containing enzyme
VRDQRPPLREEPGFAKQAKEAGLRMAYLQFDGVTNEANAHRKIKNLYDVKLRAIEELSAAGIDVILVVTIVNGVNNDQVGPIVEFAVDNADKITVVSFQPVSFTGRDEDIDPELREQQRYTLSHLAHDVARADRRHRAAARLVPALALSPFGERGRSARRPRQATSGQLNCGCHPNCGIGTVLFVNKRTKQMVPLLDFLDVEALLADFATIFEAGRPKRWTQAQLVASLLRHYKPEGAARGLRSPTLIKQFMSQTGARTRARTTRTSTSGACSSSPACGSRTCSTTIFAAPRCASSPTARSSGRSASARTTPAWAGGTSSRR